MEERYGFPGARAYLEWALADGDAVLLLDGVDEVLGGAGEEAADAAYRKVASEIDRLATRYPNSPIAVTCRRAGWHGGLPQFQTLEVLDFDWPEIQTFIENWFLTNPAKHKGLRDTLSSNLRMQTLAANPLLLSLIAIVYERELELPERRAELYNRCVEVLLKDWDAHRDIRRYSRFTTDRKRDLLGEVAWHFHRAGRRYFPADELLAIIADFLPTIDLGADHAEAILNEIVTQYGLLKVQAHGWYGFLHLTIQEYFAAVAANERGQAAVMDIAKRRHDPWWEEVILLLAGRMADASPLLLALLGRNAGAPETPPDEPLATDDDIFQGDLLLTTRCLAGTPRLRTPWLRDRLMTEVRQLLLRSPYQMLYQRAARVLAEVGGPANRADLLSLIADENIESCRRAAIARAFGDAGEAVAAPDLLGLLQQQKNPVEEVGASIAEALAKLRHVPALPVLLNVLQEYVEGQKENGADSYASQIVKAIPAFGERSVKPTLWSLLARGKTGCGAAPVCALIDGVGQLGAAEDIEPLLALAHDQSYAAAVPPAVARLAGPAIAPRLLNLLLYSHEGIFAPGALAGIAATLLKLNAPAIVPDLLSALTNPSIDWERRWLVAEILEGYPRQVCETDLVKLLARPEMDDWVRIRIAATLAAWDNSAGLPFLLTAYDKNPLPRPFAAMSEYSHVKASVWLTPARALHRLGDTTIVPNLFARYEQALRRSDYNVDDELLLLELALSPFKPIQLVSSLVQTKKSLAVDLLLSGVLTKAALPIVFDALESHEPALPNTIKAIAKLADTPEDAARLLRLLLRGISPDDCAEALAEVSRRARMRAFADGRIVRIGGDPDAV